MLLIKWQPDAWPSLLLLYQPLVPAPGNHGHSNIIEQQDVFSLWYHEVGEWHSCYSAHCYYILWWAYFQMEYQNIQKISPPPLWAATWLPCPYMSACYWESTALIILRWSLPDWLHKIKLCLSLMSYVQGFRHPYCRQQDILEIRLQIVFLSASSGAPPMPFSILQAGWSEGIYLFCGPLCCHGN